MWKVGIIGAGAIGCYFVWSMSECSEIDLFLVAEGERKTRYEKGLTINGKLYTPKVVTPEEAPQADMLIVATKYGALSGAIESLKKISTKDTIIFSVLNGVDSEDRIKEAGVSGKILHSLMRIPSVRDEKGVVFEPQRVQGIFFGAGYPEFKDAVEQAELIFENTGVKHVAEDNILEDIWFKYASNISNNLPQAVLGTDASLYYDSEHGKFLATKLWTEVYQVATKKGIALQKELFIFTNAAKTAKYSTLQDLEAGRHTEIDMLAGQLVKMAEECGMEVPYAEYTYHAIKALEEKNDGLIGK